MNQRMMRSLLDRLTRLEKRSVKHRVGVVDSTGPLSVKLGGAGVPYTNIKCVGGKPAEGQLVSVLTFGHDAIVLGPIGGFEWQHVKSNHTTLSPSGGGAGQIVYAAEFTVDVVCSGAPLLIELWGHGYMSGASGEARWYVEPRWDGVVQTGGMSFVHSAVSGGGPTPFYSRLLIPAPTPGAHTVDWQHRKSTGADGGIYASATHPLQARIHELPASA